MCGGGDYREFESLPLTFVLCEALKKTVKISFKGIKSELVDDFWMFYFQKE